LEDINDANEQSGAEDNDCNNPFEGENTNAHQIIHDDCEIESIIISNEKKQKALKNNKFINKIASIKDLFKGKSSLKNRNGNSKLKINFNKYLVNTETFANNIKSHQEENLFTVTDTDKSIFFIFIYNFIDCFCNFIF